MKGYPQKDNGVDSEMKRRDVIKNLSLSGVALFGFSGVSSANQPGKQPEIKLQLVHNNPLKLRNDHISDFMTKNGITMHDVRRNEEKYRELAFDYLEDKISKEMSTYDFDFFGRRKGSESTDRKLMSEQRKSILPTRVDQNLNATKGLMAESYYKLPNIQYDSKSLRVDGNEITLSEGGMKEYQLDDKRVTAKLYTYANEPIEKTIDLKPKVVIKAMEEVNQ